MKKIVTVTLAAILLAALLLSCADPAAKEPQDTEDPAVGVYAGLVDLLRAELEQLKKMQNEESAEYEEKIRELEEKIAVLTNQQGSQTTPPPSTQKPTDTTPESPSVPFTYVEKNGKITITGCTDDSIRVLVIPEKIDGKPITAIGDSAFAGSKLTGVSLPSGLTEIGWFAFSGSVSLMNVSVPDSVTSIGYDAFGNCPKLTVYCSSGSYGAQYAKSYGLQVVVSP